MKTQPFKAYIKSLKYNKFENKSSFGEPVQYFIQANLLEIKQGRLARKTYHNAMLYISEDEYNTRAFNEMDRIEVSERATWESKYFKLDIYDENKLKDYDKSQLKKNTNGKTYATVNFYAYTLKAKQGDWKVVERADEICYIQVTRGVKFYIDETQLDEQAYCFFFDKEVYDKIVDKNMQTFDMLCYLHKQPKWKKRIEIQTAFDESSGKYFANLIVKGDENNEE